MKDTTMKIFKYVVAGLLLGSSLQMLCMDKNDTAESKEESAITPLERKLRLMIEHKDQYSSEEMQAVECALKSPELLPATNSLFESLHWFDNDKFLVALVWLMKQDILGPLETGKPFRYHLYELKNLDGTTETLVSN